MSLGLTALRNSGVLWGVERFCPFLLASYPRVSRVLGLRGVMVDIDCAGRSLCLSLATLLSFLVSTCYHVLCNVHVQLSCTYKNHFKPSQ